MLFQHRFHPGIQNGSITLTFRVWDAPRVKVGGRYRLGPDDVVEVRAIDRQTFGAISAADVKKAGYASRQELEGALRKHAKKPLNARSPVYRVRFRHAQVEDPRLAARVDVSAGALDEVQARLERMDRLSRRGPWTRALLELIAANPRVVASKLAAGEGRETQPFKTDVRKLKGLGLTISHDIGYTLSPQGEALLKRLRT